MKKVYVTLLMLVMVNFAFAKKVKFAVDMTGIPISTLGMHIAGDFQTVAGFAGGDWMSGTTPLTQEVSDTNIYSIVVDIPAFRKYEYKFVNGDQFYEAEFVPIESRVGYNFDDNRWIYVDSLANDTTFFGAIRFAGNAPMGYHLLRLAVDVTHETTMDPAGTHVVGTFQGWNPVTSIMYKLNDTIDELIVFIDTTITSAQFKYVNGNAAGGYESVPAACATSGNRDFAVTKDTVLSVVCFSQCSACTSVGIAENSVTTSFKLYPNPTSDYSTLEFANDSNTHNVVLKDLSGRIVKSYVNIQTSSLQVEKGNLSAGIYFVSVINEAGRLSTSKLIIQ